jgi:hypothetical protein
MQTRSRSPRFPLYAVESARVESFKYYFGRKLNTKLLAENGFFLWNSKKICCFSCGVFVKQSDTIINDVNVVHFKLNSKCQYLNAMYSNRDLKKLFHKSNHLPRVTLYKSVEAPYNEIFEDFDARLKSMERADMLNKVKIARAGFFLEKGLLKCFECGLAVSSFDKSPWKLHAMGNIKCKYLLLVRGFHYANSQL